MVSRPFERRHNGNASGVVWLVLLIVLIAVFGVGALLKAAFWMLPLIAAVAVVAGLAVARLVRR